MPNDRNNIAKGRVVLFGSARITQGDEVKEVRRGAFIEFEDTAGLELALNSGFAELDMPDDTVAHVLIGQPKKSAP